MGMESQVTVGIKDRQDFLDGAGPATSDDTEETVLKRSAKATEDALNTGKSGHTDKSNKDQAVILLRGIQHGMVRYRVCRQG